MNQYKQYKKKTRKIKKKGPQPTAFQQVQYYPQQNQVPNNQQGYVYCYPANYGYPDQQYYQNAINYGNFMQQPLQFPYQQPGDPYDQLEDLLMERDGFEFLKLLGRALRRELRSTCPKCGRSLPQRGKRYDRECFDCHQHANNQQYHCQRVPCLPYPMQQQVQYQNPPVIQGALPIQNVPLTVPQTGQNVIQAAMIQKPEEIQNPLMNTRVLGQQHGRI